MSYDDEIADLGIPCEHISDKYAAGWPSDILFSQWDVKAILTRMTCPIRSLERSDTMQKSLSDKLGVEYMDWMMFLNHGEKLDDEVYLKDTNSILVWKLTDPDGLRENIESIQIYDHGAERDG